MDSEYGHDFTEDLEAVARGVRRLDDIADPVERDAIRAALGLVPRSPGLDDAARGRLRRAIVSLRSRHSDVAGGGAGPLVDGPTNSTRSPRSS